MRKALYIAILLIFSVATVSFGQKAETINLETGVKLINSESNANGLVLITGKEYIFNPKLNWNVTFYNPDLSKRYEVPIKKPTLNWETAGHLVVSPSGNNVYYIHHKDRL